MRCLLLPTGCTHEKTPCAGGVAPLEYSSMPVNPVDGQMLLRHQANIRFSRPPGKCRRNYFKL